MAERQQEQGVCYLVGAGDSPRPFATEAGDMLIAVDGGYDAVRRMGARPDLLIGDLDSLQSAADLPHDLPRLTFPARKDETDMLLAWREGYRRGYRRFCVLGGTGGRPDHTFANYALLLAARRAGARAILVGPRSCAMMLEQESVTLRAHGREGHYLSLFPFDGAAKGVTLRGLCYTAEDITLTPDYPLAVSNAFTSQDAFLQVRAGALLLVIEEAVDAPPDLSLLSL